MVEYKQIRVDQTTYNRLSDMRKPGESFNKFFKRTMLGEKKGEKP